ncbi:MAG: cupin domain-containing protein [Actinobacteria bacterium]|nr:cupin domain-containing protein [Actinomycetota bacterium]
MQQDNLKPYKFNEEEINKKIFEDRWVRFAFGSQGYVKTNDLSLGIVEFDKNKTSLSHSHDVSEALYVLSGIGAVNVAGELNQVKKGDFLYIPPNMEHSIITEDTDKLKIFFVFGGKIYIDY